MNCCDSGIQIYTMIVSYYTQLCRSWFICTRKDSKHVLLLKQNKRFRWLCSLGGAMWTLGTFSVFFYFHFEWLCNLVSNLVSPRRQTFEKKGEFPQFLAWFFFLSYHFRLPALLHNFPSFSSGEDRGLRQTWKDSGTADKKCQGRIWDSVPERVQQIM